jgi:protein-disulfide isomerase/uncharacterized membrane protein
MISYKYKLFACLIILLSIAGLALSVFLTFDFYHPEAAGRFISCGDGISDSCTFVSQSKYSSVFGIPLSSYAILFYTFVLFILLTAAYAGGKYYLSAWGVLFPLSAASLIIDIILAGILIKLGKLCQLCVATYLVNILIFVCFLFYLKGIKKEWSVNVKQIFLYIFRIEPLDHDRRAVAGLFFLFSVMLVCNVFISGLNMNRQNHEGKMTPREIENAVKEFYESQPVNAEFPESDMILGTADAPVEIKVFTDFFCKACYQFYLSEKYLFSKYGDQIRVVYYNYPLGGSCTTEDGKQNARRSCIAARAFVAAGALNIFTPYLVSHYRRHQELHKAYSESKAIEVASGMIGDAEAFKSRMNSPDTAAILERDMELGHQLNITVTPTLFIKNRPILGVPPNELLEAIIEKAMDN